MKGFFIAAGIAAIGTISVVHAYCRPEDLSMCLTAALVAVIMPALVNHEWSGHVLGVLAAFCVLSAARWIVPLPFHLHHERVAARPGAMLAVLLGTVFLTHDFSGATGNTKNVWTRSLCASAVIIACGLATGFIFISQYFFLQLQAVGEVVFNLAIIWGTYNIFQGVCVDRSSRRTAAVYVACCTACILAATVWRWL